MTDDRTAHDPQDQEAEPPPELADWWVWGVRRVAAVIADFLHSVRFIPLVFILFKGAMWAFTRDPNELWGAGMLLGRFSAERDSPDPERWLLRHRRAKCG